MGLVQTIHRQRRRPASRATTTIAKLCCKFYIITYSTFVKMLTFISNQRRHLSQHRRTWGTGRISRLRTERGSIHKA